jgi:receptor protein-tyrosine kinase
MPLTPFSKRRTLEPGPSGAGAFNDDDARTGTSSDHHGPATEGVPLASILPRKFIDDAHLVMVNSQKDAVAERYRRLRARLEVPSEDGTAAPRTILVTSAVPDEGKTTTAFNLALAFSEERQRSTVLVDLDLRRPSVGRYLMPAPKVGVTELLTSPIGLEHALITPTGTRLSVLPAGKPRSNPTELLRSASLATLLAELGKRFDWVVVDTPPIVPFSDASVLQPLVDGTILVVRAGATSKATVERALENLEGGFLLGVVLNDVVQTPVDRYYYRYDDYDPYRYTDQDEGDETP